MRGVMSWVSIVVLVAGCATATAPYPDFKPLAPANETVKVTSHSPFTNTLDEIPVQIHQPATLRPNRPALIYLGHCDGVLEPSDAAILADLLARGVTIAQVESMRGTHRPTMVCQDKISRVTAGMRIEEAYKVRDLLVAKGLAHVDNVAVMGTSHGGLAVTNLVFDHEVKVPFKAGLAIYPHCQTMDVKNFHLRIPALVMIGEKDDWTPAHRCVELQRRSLGDIPFRLRVFEGAYHSYDSDKPARTVRTGTDKGFSFLQFDRAATIETHRLSREFFIQHLGL
jgi:dienelactone hydrolase